MNKIRINYKNIILLAFLLSGTVCSFGQDITETGEVISLFHELYSFRFGRAEGELKKIRVSGFNPDIKDICTANYYWWQIATRADYDAYSTEMLAALDRIIQRHKKKEAEQLEDDELFAITFAYAYKTRLDMHKGKYFKGAGNLNKTVKYLEIVMPKALEDDKFMLLAGLYHYVAGSLIERYPVFRPLFAFGPDPDIGMGYSYLDKCTNNEHPLIRTEARYFMMRVKNEILEENRDADEIVGGFLLEYPDNLYFRSSRICILADDQREAEIKRELEILRSAGTKSTTEQVQFGFILNETEKYLRKKRIKF